MKNLFKGIADIDWNLFGKIYSYNIGFFAAFVVVAQILSSFFKYSIQSMTSISDVSSITPESLQAVSTTGLLTLIAVTILAAVLVEFYSYSFFENLIWNTIVGKKTNFKNTNRFTLFNVIVLAILALIVFVLSLIIGQLAFGYLTLSTSLVFVILVIAFYLLYVGYLSFAKTGNILTSLKNLYFVGIKKFHMTIFPLVVSLIISALLNYVLLFAESTSLPVLANFVLEIVVFAAYLSWFRIYLTDALKSVKF